ncbi:unnamed protein product [Paramecium sonneborni]|uniref:Uncharacterized protein n=1 Tax=Paramecium sonneborni TaxID=65129 RepID=A0A8S1RTZ0_9CILI|nr:unnamed protein product [Paramecium sonneborni]
MKKDQIYLSKFINLGFDKTDYICINYLLTYYFGNIQFEIIMKRGIDQIKLICKINLEFMKLYIIQLLQYSLLNMVIQRSSFKLKNLPLQYQFRYQLLSQCCIVNSVDIQYQEIYEAIQYNLNKKTKFLNISRSCFYGQFKLIINNNFCDIDNNLKKSEKVFPQNYRYLQIRIIKFLSDLIE